MQQRKWHPTPVNWVSHSHRLSGLELTLFERSLKSSISIDFKRHHRLNIPKNVMSFNCFPSFCQNLMDCRIQVRLNNSSPTKSSPDASFNNCCFVLLSTAKLARSLFATIASPGLIGSFFVFGSVVRTFFGSGFGDMVDQRENCQVH